MTDEEYLEAQRKARAESVEFFRASNKPERERWVVREFLTNLGLVFADTEVRSPLWDRQLERDVAAGKLDVLAEKALRDHAAGKTTSL